jgi:hypothetical protein
VGGLALVGLLVAIVVAVTSALSPADVADGGRSETETEQPTESETPTPTPTDAASDGVIALDEYGVFEVDPDFAVELPSSWEQTVEDDDGQDVWVSDEIACSFDTIVDSAPGGDTEADGGDEEATAEVVEADAESLASDYSVAEVVETGGTVVLLAEDGTEIEFMTSEVDYVTDDGVNAYFLIGTRQFVDSGVYLSFALSCDETQDPSVLDDVLADVLVATS